MNEDEMRELFREMREEPVPANSLARVRARVEQRIGEKSLITAWKIAAVLAVAGCIAVGFVLLRPVKTLVPPVPPVLMVQAPASEIAQAAPPPPQIPVRGSNRPKRRVPASETVPVLIRIETPDPDVVILLVN